jgi:CheY-like chemotaxis protein
VCELCETVAETTLNGQAGRTFSAVSARVGQDRWMRVLVVEDEKRLAAGLRNGLEADGFAVDVVNNGTDGLWMAREHPFDAIVLDILLPGIDGYRVCATLREEGNWTPILMLTAKEGEWDEVEGPRHRRRRLLDQTVLLRRAGRAAAGAAAPRCPRPPPSVKILWDHRGG